MKVVVCIVSSCHIKGSHQVINGLEKLINENGLAEKVLLASMFCMGKCGNGVSVLVDDESHSVKPEEVEEFFDKNIMAKF